MKKLDEVIKALEICNKPDIQRLCKDCDYGGDECGLDNLQKDALHYLKAYRENQIAYEDGNRKAEEARERYIEAVKNCELAENKYKKLAEEASQNLVNTSQNEPLTWDELQTMEGKPVWIWDKTGFKNYESWVLIAESQKWDDQILIYLPDHSETAVAKDDIGKTWQAYRREG